jgi:hypothetical protein
MQRQYTYTKPGLAFYAGQDQTVVVLPLSKLLAGNGCAFHAQPGSSYIAENGSTGFVQRGSLGLARAGSKVYGSGRATIFAGKDSWVRAVDGDVVLKGPGAQVVAARGAKVIEVDEVELPFFNQPESRFAVPNDPIRKDLATRIDMESFLQQVEATDLGVESDGAPFRQGVLAAVDAYIADSDK